MSWSYDEAPEYPQEYFDCEDCSKRVWHNGDVESEYCWDCVELRCGHCRALTRRRELYDGYCFECSLGMEWAAEPPDF